MSRAFGVVFLAGAVAAVTVASWSAAPTASADWYGKPGPAPYASRRIRCESDGRRPTYCETRAWGRVWLERRLSNAPCREYDTWGADRDGGGVWVSGGCRGIFVVTPYGGPGYGPGYPPGHRPGHRPEQRVTCKSKDFRPNYCRLPRGGRVRLERRLSDAPCREHDTWGVDGGGIWVARGCAAVFSVR